MRSKPLFPLNAYQMGNLVDALSQVHDNGDWWGEFLNMVWAAMDKLGIAELRSNNGRTFTKDQVWSRNIRIPADGYSALPRAVETHGTQVTGLAGRPANSDAHADSTPRFETIKLQARRPEGGDWIDIFPAQLQWMAKEGNDVRALEAVEPDEADDWWQKGPLARQDRTEK